MATRNICINIPVPLDPLSMTVPGVGDVAVVRQFVLGAVNICEDARAFIQSIQPIFAGLGLPLCVLGCVTAVTQMFSEDFPYVDPAALSNMVSACACLTTFTPFGFCGMLRGLVQAILALVSCMIGLLADIAALEAQAAALLANPETLLTGQCVGANANILRNSMVSSFGPVSTLFDSASFLFQFVGVTVSSLGSLSGGTTSEVLDALLLIQDSLLAANTAINSVCP